MKLAYRVVILVSMFCASLMGGALATHLAPKSVQAEASALAFGPQVKVSAMQVPNVGALPFSSTYAKIDDIGTFTVESASSLVEVTHQGKLLIHDVVGSTNGVYFQLRVDDVQPLNNTGMSLILTTEAGEYVPCTFSGFWQNLSAGQHTVSLWVRTSTSGSTADAVMNPGGWENNDVIVKEYLPMGSTFMPTILN